MKRDAVLLLLMAAGAAATVWISTPEVTADPVHVDDERFTNCQILTVESEKGGADLASMDSTSPGTDALCSPPGAVVESLPSSATAPPKPAVSGPFNAFPSPCILKFTADWCGPCRSDECRELEEWLKRSKWTVLHVDVDVNRDLVNEIGIAEIPTFVIVRKSREVGRYTGVLKSEFLPILKGATQ